MTEVNDNTAQRDRSPAYPFVPLEIALTRLAEFETYFKRRAARRGKVGEAWSIKSQAYADRTLAALGYFGLLEYRGAGKDRQIVISDEGRKYLRTQQEETKREVVQAAAIRPRQIAKFWNEWGIDRPVEAACLDELVLKNGFSEAGAREFLKVYDATISYAGLSDSDKKESDYGTKSETAGGEGAAMPTAMKPAHVRGPAPPMASLPIGRPRIVMNGDHLDIQASVDLEGLKQLQTMLQKYAEILEMMTPGKDEAANYRGYEIIITEKPPGWQAAIYPTQPNMPKINWESEPINEMTEAAARAKARLRIDKGAN